LWILVAVAALHVVEEHGLAWRGRWWEWALWRLPQVVESVAPIPVLAEADKLWSRRKAMVSGIGLV